MSASRGAKRRALKTAKKRQGNPSGAGSGIGIGGAPPQAEVQRIMRLYKAARFSESVEHARRLAMRWPEHPVPWNLLAASLKEAGRTEEAAEAAARVAEILPHEHSAQANLALLLFECGELLGAEAACKRAVRLKADHAETRLHLATILRDLGRLAEAEVACRETLTVRPGFPEGFHTLGQILQAQGRLKEAEDAFRKVLSLRSTHAEAHNDLGNVLCALGRLKEAEAVYTVTVANWPDYPEANFNLGFVLQAQGRSEEAEGAYRDALALRPTYVEAYNNLGKVLSDSRRPEEAEEAYRKALEFAPDHADAQCNLGYILFFQGRREEAEDIFKRVLEQTPGSVDACYGLAQVRKATSEDPAFQALEGVLDTGQATPVSDRRKAHFALGKMYADTGADDSAFDHLVQGHQERARHLAHSYDPAAVDAKLEAIRTVFTTDFFRKRRGHGLDTEAPVLVVGMPRSGTSLVEQILASHSRVFGAGELGMLKELANGLFGSGSSEEERNRVCRLTEANGEKLGIDYLEYLTRFSGEAPRVVDKMPHNFEHLWLAALLVPKATVLHCVRSPLDTCLSCFFQNFDHGHVYTDDLRSLGHHYNYYSALMRHWRAVLPISIHDVVYENLVGDDDKEIPRLLETCGLEFDSACLEFHKTERVVSTASAAQVRRKVYTSSVERWRRYESHLGPLREALGAVD